MSTAAELLLGAIAGALAQIFTIPVSVIATRQQLGRGLAKARALRKPGVSYAQTASAPPAPTSVVVGAEKAQTAAAPQTVESDDSFLGVAREIIAEEGVTGLWLGIKPGLVLTVNPAITYGVFERLKTLLLAGPTSSGKLSPGRAFVIGAFSKTLATIVRTL
jgi:adenine nucleotide transporter 17